MEKTIRGHTLNDDFSITYLELIEINFLNAYTVRKTYIPFDKTVYETEFINKYFKTKKEALKYYDEIFPKEKARVEEFINLCKGENDFDQIEISEWDIK